MKRKLAVFLSLSLTLLVVACAISDSLVTKVPPRSSTHSTIWVMKQRILRYARVHDSLPGSPYDLPEIPQKITTLQDAWGRDIQMTFADGRATLTSLGRDGRRGGLGDDADMTGVFPLSNENGGWANEDVDWVQEPEL